MGRGPSTPRATARIADAPASKGKRLRALCLGTLLIALCALLALLDGESGLGIWHELRVDLEVSRARVADLVEQNEALRREIVLLEADPTAMDRVIREELDMALAGELVVHFFVAGGGER